MKSNSKGTDRIKEPSKFVIKVANSVFMLGIVFFVFIAVYAGYKVYTNPEYKFYFGFLLFAVLTTSLFGIGLRMLRDELKVNISILLITASISIFTFETYLEFLTEDSRKVIADQMGVPFDTRTTMEVLADLRDSGNNTYSNNIPSKLVKSNGLNTVKGKIYPFGGVSNITKILGNESGYFPVIETDEHGFNNPKGLYQINKVDIVLTGDSYTEGYSVYPNENIGDVLRQLDFNAISLGKAGNGSLIELATLKEYAEPLKPKIVLWVYYVNDIEGLEHEISSSFLRKYLNENNFSQNLISRQEEIDSLLVNLQVKDPLIKSRAFNILKMYNLRERINLIPKPRGWEEGEPTFTPIFKNILQKSNQMVSEWGGKMYFIYLPSFDLYSNNNERFNREFVLHSATELDIPIIDIHKEVFDLHPDPFSLFPFRMSGHYTAEGYRLVAETIGKRLKADGIIPLNSRK